MPVDVDQSPATLAAKAAMRAEAFRRRADAFAVHGTRTMSNLAHGGLDFLQLPTGASVSGFSAIRDEIDPSALLDRLHRNGVALALPCMQRRGERLIMRAWSPGDEMRDAQWGIKEPMISRPEVEPDVVLVPLLAFDERGYRLGYGGGFYDRTLDYLRRRKPVIAVGIAFDELKVDAVPVESYDQPLDWVLTPSGPRQCTGR